MKKWMLEDAHVAVGLNHLGMGNFDRAIKYLDKELSKRESPDLYYWLGFVCRAAGLACQVREEHSDYVMGPYVTVKNTEESEKLFEKSIHYFKEAITLYEED